MNRTATILHLRASNFLGGPERQILSYGVHAGAGWCTQIASFVSAKPGGADEGGELLRQARAAGLEAWALPGGGWRDLRALGTLLRLLREQHVDLICTHGYRADLLGTLAARQAGIPVAWFLRGWTGESLKVRLYEAGDRVLLGTADRIVCLSQAQAARLQPRVDAERLRVVVNCVARREPGQRAAALASLRRRAPIAGSPGTPLVAIAGRLSPEKGARFFVAAAAQLREACPLAQFLVAGDGPLRARLEAQARAAGLDGRLHFLGHVANWSELLPALDILVNPSLSEQAPNVVLEAMAAGVAVVATAVGGVAEIAGLGDPEPAVELVAPGEPEALAAALRTLLDHPERRAALAARGRERVRETYSPERQQEQLQSLYRELLVPAGANAARPGGGAQLAPAAAQPLPEVSVVLPVRGEAEHLGRVLDQLLQQDYPASRFEILVADGGYEDEAAGVGDGTTGLIQSYALRFAGRLRWLPNPRRSSSAGRNQGLAAARGEWIVFVDGHCQLPGRDWLSRSMHAAREAGAVCLSRPQPLMATPGQLWQSAIAHARAARIGHGADSTIYAEGDSGWVDPGSSGAAYHRSVFQAAGGYDERFDACEDVEFNHRVARAGVRGWLCPEATVHYYARTSLAGLWRQMVRYGRGRMRLARKHPDAFSLPQALPALWLAGVPLALAGAFALSGFAAGLCAAGLLAYAAIVAASAIQLGRRYGWREGLAAPAAFLVIHAGLGAGAWRELMSRPARPTLRPDSASFSPALSQSRIRSAS